MLRTFVLGLVFTLGLAGSGAAQVELGFGGQTFDNDAPVEITSDMLAVDQTTGEAIFSGNVVVVQGGLRMAAAEIRVVYLEVEGTREVDRIVARGGVLITNGADAAEATEAVYRVANSTMTMSGDVLVTQGATTIAGDRMVVDMATGSGTMDGRVRTILGPASSQ